MRAVLSRVKTASRVSPMSLNGIESNHTTGKMIRAKKASGQHRINRINHPTVIKNRFIY